MFKGLLCKPTSGHWYIQMTSLWSGKPESAPLFLFSETQGGQLDAAWHAFKHLHHLQHHKWAKVNMQIRGLKENKDCRTLFSIIRSQGLISLWRRGRYDFIGCPDLCESGANWLRDGSFCSVSLSVPSLHYNELTFSTAIKMCEALQKLLSRRKTETVT